MVDDSIKDMLEPIREGIDTIQGMLSGVVSKADVQKAIDERVAPLEQRVDTLERRQWILMLGGIAIGVVLGAVAL